MNSDELLDEALAWNCQCDTSKPRNIKVAMQKVTAYRVYIEAKKDRQYEEREATVCPEDIGFEEYINIIKAEIKNQTKRITELESEIERLWKALEQELSNALSEDCDCGFETDSDHSYESPMCNRCERISRLQDILAHSLPQPESTQEQTEFEKRKALIENQSLF